MRTFHLEVLQVLLGDDGGLPQLAEEADPHVPLQAAFARFGRSGLFKLLKIELKLLQMFSMVGRSTAYSDQLFASFPDQDCEIDGCHEHNVDDGHQADLQDNTKER